MTNDKNGIGCELGCWGMAAGAGALTFVLLLVLGSASFVAAIFLSGLLFATLGFLLSVICCANLPAIGEVVPGEDRGLHATPPGDTAPKPAAPKPAPAAPATPAAAPVKAAKAATAEPAVKPSKPLPGQDDLSTRKGEWSYTGADAPASASTKPTTLSAARADGPDDLKRIKGVGPKLEALLHSMGFYHFDQIAVWTDAEVAWVDDNLEGFKGRVTRDEWVAQARQFAAES